MIAAPHPGVVALHELMQRSVVALLAPPPTLTVSEWADEYRYVPSYSAEPGKWVTDRTPYLREIMDSFSSPGVQEVVFKKCARIGATEAGLNVVGYFMHMDPCAIMIIQPTVEDAKGFSKDQLATTIEETPVLRALVSDAVKSSKNTITAKKIPGGSVTLGGANSPRVFRRVTVRVMIFEEINGYSTDAKAKGEGDQIKLGERRTQTHGPRRKIYKNSTPTNVGECRITAEYARSDQRQYHVPCPHCGRRQQLVWDHFKYKDADTGVLFEQPGYQCVECNALITEDHKDRMVARGEWVVMKPDSTIRGYHLNALYSPFVRWSVLRDEWIEAQGNPELLQPFFNLSLGEAWEDREVQDLQDALRKRSLPYDGRDLNSDAPRRFDIPRGACILVCGVDKQAAELHYVVRAYGPNEQSWFVEWGLFRGDTSRPEVWAQLEEFRTTRTWLHEGGARMKIRAMCVDSGDDPDPVYSWTGPRLADYVFAVKGASDPFADILPKKWTKTRLRSRLFVIGTQAIKKRLFRRAGMAAPVPYSTEAGAAFMHWNERAEAVYWSEFFSQKLVRLEHRGRSTSIYAKRSGEHDEKLDCEVYAYAALHLGPVTVASLQGELEKVLKEGEETAKNVPAPPASKAMPRTSRGGWVKPPGGKKWI